MSAPAPTFARRAVAALFLERQHLVRPRALRFTARNVVRWIADTGGLQMDSINVVERAHYLTTWSRFGPYPRATLDRIAYRKRLLFEYWAHCACLVAREDLPAWRRAMQDFPHRYPVWDRSMKKHAAATREVLGAIEANGPMSSADFKHARPQGESGWWNWKPATNVLNHQWFAGRLAVHSRVHFHKRYDLIERVLPEVGSLAIPSREAFVRWHVAKSLHAMGAATETDLRMYLSSPRIKAGERQRGLQSLVRAGEVVEVRVHGDRGRWFALARDLDALAAAGRRRGASRGTTLLAPFDSFLWHRERTERLFGFDYRIEVYTPGAKRVHGYYTLPLLHDGQLVGRVDAKTHRVARRLEVKRVHFEPWVARGQEPPAVSWGMLDRDALLAGLAGALRSLAVQVGADVVTLGRVAPSSLRSPLLIALEASARPSAEAQTVMSS